MLLEFRVGNYRSIRDEHVLSMVASKDKSHKKTHTLETGIKSLPQALRSVVVYGPNASGKSNLINALQFFVALIRDSATKVKPTQDLNVTPFRLDNSYVNDPTEFEISFIKDDVRYQYGYALTKKRIIREWLLVYKSFRPQQWFYRYLNEKTGEHEFEFSSYLKGQKNQWAELTRENALFLSTAAQWNSEQLEPIFDYLTNGIAVFGANQSPGNEYTISRLADEKWHKEICKFLSSADIGIKEIKVEREKGMTKSVHFDFDTGEHDIRSEESMMALPKFYHQTNKGEAIFDLHEESMGTQRLFALAGPILDILRKGLILAVDEIDSSLHPLMVRHLIGLFNNEETNKNGAQLLVTTHDTSLLDTNILRRDQIWFVEKNNEQASEIYPLSDFSPRNKEALEKGYLSGRYGGLPVIKELSW